MTDTSADELPSLSWKSFGLCLVIVLAIYAFLNPIWTGLYLDEVDRNIWWSYAPIPFLVAGFLALEHKLRWASWLVEVMRLTLAKFAITYVVSHGIWVVMGAPPSRGEPEPVPMSQAESVGLYTVTQAPPVSVVDPEQTGSVVGVVVDADGAPAPNVWVGVSAGLESLSFDVTDEPIVLRNAGGGFGSADTFVRTYQPIELRNEDELLHTAFATDARGRRLFNYPIPPDAVRELMFERTLGPVTLGCRAHGADEPTVLLMVAGHPFWTRTDDQGRFELSDVPAGDLELAAYRSGGHAARIALRLGAGDEGSARLTFPPRAP